MSYVSTVIADAPLHFWRAADGGGQLAHDLGSRPWTIHCGSLLLGYTGVNSDGGAMFCAGNNGLTSAQALPGTLIAPVTIEMFVYTVDFTGVFQDLCDISGGANSLLMGWNATGHFQFGTAGVAAIDPTAHTDQAWYHLVGTYDLANVRLYVNAVNVATQAAVAAQTYTGQQIGWGESRTGANPSYTLIAECCVYNVALAAARVTAHFTASGWPGTSPIYQAPATFDPASGTTTPDSTTLTQILNAVRKTY